MAFTLISISKLDKAGYSVTFNKGMCKIMNRKGQLIATIPHANGLYRVTGTKPSAGKGYANTASGKMTISEAHRKLGHISCRAIEHAVKKGYITGIELEADSKPDFCEACAKAKATRQPFPKESKTRAKNYGERVHWDLWGPATVKSINGHYYVAARVDDATRETKIETQTGNRIKVSRSDRGGEFSS